MADELFDEPDPLKAAANLEDHGVSFEEAQQAFADPWVLSMTDHHHDDRYVAVGCDKSGRLLFVVYEWRGERIRIIHAREASERLRRQYGEKRR